MDGYLNADLTVNTVATTPAGAEVSPNRSGRRISWFVKNTSSGGAAAAIISVFCVNTLLDLSAQTGGYVLDPKQTITDSKSADYECWQGRILAISDTDGATLSIAERVE